jgi:hypothetical protein
MTILVGRGWRGSAVPGRYDTPTITSPRLMALPWQWGQVMPSSRVSRCAENLSDTYSDTYRV